MKTFQFGHLKFQGKILNYVVKFEILALYFAIISSGFTFCVSQKAYKHQILALKLLFFKLSEIAYTHEHVFIEVIDNFFFFVHAQTGMIVIHLKSYFTLTQLKPTGSNKLENNTYFPKNILCPYKQVVIFSQAQGMVKKLGKNQIMTMETRQLFLKRQIYCIFRCFCCDLHMRS